MIKERDPGARRPKRGRPPTGKGKLVTMRFPTDFLREVDDWLGVQPVPPTRAAAIRRFAELGLLQARGTAGTAEKSRSPAQKARPQAGLSRKKGRGR
jgi:hypothetical protein